MARKPANDPSPLPTTTFSNTSPTDVFVEAKVSRSFELDHQQTLRQLTRRQYRLEQTQSAMLFDILNPIDDRKGARNEVWREDRLKQALAVRPVWMRTCHCVDCVRYRFIEKAKERRDETARMIRQAQNRAGGHLVGANPSQDTVLNGHEWDLPAITVEDGDEAGVVDAEGTRVTLTAEVPILDLLRPPRRRRRIRSLPRCVAPPTYLSADARDSLHKTMSDGWVSLHDDLADSDSSISWDRCSVASA